MISYSKIDIDLEGRPLNKWYQLSMKNFDLQDVKFLIGKALSEQPTGDDWLDSRYNEQVHYIGHTNPYYRLFYYLAEFLKPELVVELGTWQGTGSAHFAAGNPDGQVVAIDIHKDDKAAQLRTIEAASHYDNLSYLNRWTEEAVDFIKNLNQPIDILFSDSWHDYTRVKNEWELYKPLMGKNSLVIFDDITNDYNFDKMTDFWEELPEPKFLFSNGLHGNIPMGFMIFNLENEETNVDTNREPDTTKPTGTKKRGRPSGYSHKK